MPTVENLDRLQGILARLRPLAETRRGELIRSDDWNTVVAALLELARAVLAEGATTEVPLHSHDEQVQLSWLDARLRSLLQEGPLGDPRGAARLADLERRLERAGGDLGGVRDEVAALRARIGDVATRDVAREADLTSVRLSVEGIGDARRDVLTLRQSLDAIRTDVQRALELGTRLTVDGEPLDASDLLERLGRVEELRERLTTEDGGVLDGAAIERRLAQHAASIVTVDQMDAALKRLRPRVSEEQLAAIRQDVLGAASAQVESSLTSLREEVAADLERRLGDVDARIAAGVSAATPGVRDEVLAAARATLEEALERTSAETRKSVEGLLEAELGRVVRDLTGLVESTRDTTLAAASDRTDAVLRDAVAPLRERLGKVESVAESSARAVGDLRAHVAAVDERVGALDSRFDEVVERAVGIARDQAAEMIRSEVAGVHERLDGMVEKAVSGRVEELAARLREEMRGIANEGDDALRAEVRKTVPVVVERAMSTLPDRFARDFKERGPLFEVMARMVDERTQRR